MKRRAKPERLVHRDRVQPARRFLVAPDPTRPFVVEVRVARTRKRMREELLRIDNAREDLRTMGLVRHWMSKVTSRTRFVIRPRGVIARMYLNVRDLQDRPSEIVSHECTHAGMAWARLQRANLHVMAGEEVLCHAVGQLVRQVNHHLFAMKVFRP